MNPDISISKSGPGAKRIAAQLDRIARMEVLVGIPQATAPRRGDEINNPSLMYILTHGSPVRHIPATPWIEPAIEADGNRQAISKELSLAAKAHLEEKPREAFTQLKRAGMVGANACKAWATDARNGWPPNAPSTIKRKGSDRRNIDTGALRASLTSVVRSAG